MQKYETNEELDRILHNCEDPRAAARAVQFTAELTRQNHLVIEGHRWQALANHVIAMVDRCVTGEKLLEFDTALFHEIGASSIGMAQQIVEHIGNLDEREKYLLSVHFEIAKV